MTQPIPVDVFEGQLTASQVLQYTVPASDVLEITDIQLVNTSGTAATVRIDRVPAGGTDGATLEIYNASVAANATVDAMATIGPIVLGPGDKLYVGAGTASVIDCTISGILTPR